jgi:restriction endonuclease S subunit
VKSSTSSTLGLSLILKPWKWKLVQIYFKRFRKGQVEDEKVQEIKPNIKEERSLGFSEDEEGVLWYNGTIYVSNVKELKDNILREEHESAYSVHPGGNKVYHDLMATYWWYGMKRDVAEYVAPCDTCQRVKAEHQ